MSTKCICGATETAPFGEKNGGKVERCTSCLLLRRTDYSPEAIEALYTEGDYYHTQLQRELGHDPYTDRYWHDFRIGRMRLDIIHSQYRLLDVGCANGAFLAVAKQMGFRAVGLEPNEQMAQFAHEVTDCPIHTAWTTVRGGFDIITYHDVIEHVVDPQAEIDRAATYLNDGGTLVLDTPDAEDRGFTDLGMDWHHMRPEQHLWYFREQDLQKMCLLANLEVVYVDRPIPGKIVVYARKGMVS